MKFLKNPRIQLLAAALGLVILGSYLKIDIPAVLDNLSTVADKLGELAGDDIPVGDLTDGDRVE